MTRSAGSAGSAGSARTGSVPAAAAHAQGWHRPARGGLIAVAGAVAMLVSLFLPWYGLRLRVANYADLSRSFLLIHADGGQLTCTQVSSDCVAGARVGVLATGIFGWRSLIAVGAAAIVLYVALRAMPNQPALDRRRDHLALAVLAAGTAGVTAAAAVAGPLHMPDLAARIGLTSSLSYGAAVGLAGAGLAVAGGLLAWRARIGEADHGERLEPAGPHA